VLRSFHDSSVDFEQVGPFKCFEAEEIKAKVSFEVDGSVELLVVLTDDLVNFLGEERRIAAALVLAVIELLGHIFDGGPGLFSQIVHGDPRGEDAVMRVDDVLGKKEVPCRRRSQRRGCPARPW